MAKGTCCLANQKRLCLFGGHRMLFLQTSKWKEVAVSEPSANDSASGREKNAPPPE